MTATEQHIQPKALAWTIGVHLLLFLFFFLYKYVIPTATPIPEMGMEVNLGTSEHGSGYDQPLVAEDPAADAASVDYKKAQQQENEAKDMLQTPDPDAPSVKAANSKNIDRNSTQQDNDKRHKSKQQEANNSQSHQRPRYVYNASSGKGGNGAMQNYQGSNEGNDNSGGDKGVPNGTPGSANYSGSPGKGTGGISHTLTGRIIVAFPPKDANFKEQGTVVVRVTVNREGLIVNKQIISASSADLRAIALRKTDKVRFNKSDAAPEEQFGNITFVFKTRD